ncbi:MAG: DUF4974 domain-containing protein [Muribaculaceae bacterium]|nr:DUF4974 domain-containing protein [Muribaculaceae bacterium]
MDKYEIVLDIIERPENYSASQLKEIFSDYETRQIYNLLCEVDASMKENKEIDIETEWKIFRANQPARSRHLFKWFSSRVASIVIALVFSILAVVAGLVVTNILIDSVTKKTEDAHLHQEDLGDNYLKDSVIDSMYHVEIKDNLILFEDVPLEVIMKQMATAYNVNILFNSETTAKLHLYYTLDLSLPLNDIVEQLNTFEQININFRNKTLIVE